MLIQPVQAEELMSIVSGKKSKTMVNVDKVLHLGQQQIVSFKCLRKNYSITNKVVTIKSNKNTEQFGDHIIDTHLIYIAVLLDLWSQARLI